MASAAPINAFLAERENSDDVRARNVQAAQALSAIMKSSLGPNGLDKMLVDGVGEMLITNDGATILQQLDVQHPAAKVLVDLSDLQDQEVGDGTTSVVILAAELLRRGNALVERGVHPSWVLQAFKTAGKEATQYVGRRLTQEVRVEDREMLMSIARTSLSSKLVGGDAEFFSRLVCDAVPRVRVANELTGRDKYPVKSINVLKTHGRSTRESFVVDGFAFSHIGRAAQGMPGSVTKAKIAVIEFPLKQYRAHMGVQVLVTDPEELEKIRQKEKDITKDRVTKILASGANVVLTSEGIDDMACKYFVEAGVLAVRRIPKADLRRVARAVKAKPVLTMASADSDEESFDPAWLGSAEEVCEERVGDWDYIFVKGCSGGRAASIILRGANDYLVDEVERCIHDAICVVSRTLENLVVCAGGGAVETALAVHLHQFAATVDPKLRDGVVEFGNAMLVVPKVLAVNAAQDATELLGQLRAAHFKSQTEEGAESLKWTGLDLLEGTIRDNLKAGVVEPALVKTKSIRLATEAAVAILRIDDIVKVHPDDPSNPGGQ